LANFPLDGAVDWSIWTFCYALGKLPLDFVRGTPVASNQGVVDVPMIFSLLQSADGERVLVDTGFGSGASMTGRNFANFVRSDELLRRHGFDPLGIRKLVLTHLHFDHAGNIAAFPNAEIFVQRYEYESWKRVIADLGTGGVSKDQWAFSSLNADDFTVLDKAIADGRVTFLDGDAEIAGGVNTRLAKDTHSFGIQWLEIETPRGPYVLGGDICYTYFNVERMWPPGYLQGNAWNILYEMRRIKGAIGDDLSRLIPGHDIEILARLPNGAPHGSHVVELTLAAGQTSIIR
jgi:N-acyl homoserine lactone hydrolase